MAVYLHDLRDKITYCKRKCWHRKEKERQLPTLSREACRESPHIIFAGTNINRVN